jgi:hypothetical protein
VCRIPCRSTSGGAQEDIDGIGGNPVKIRYFEIKGLPPQG